MEPMIQLLLTLISTLSAFFVLVYYFYHHHCHRNPNNVVPRAGGALPIIGHLHLFGGKQLLHKTLAAMAEKHGPAFTMKLGSQENLVISSWEMAKECYTTLDKVFSDRPRIAASRILGYNCAMFGFAPYGAYWRQMRKIATLELLSHRRIDMLAHIRTSELQASLKELYDLWADSRGAETGSVMVDLKQWFGDMTLNAFVRMVGGKKRFGGGGGEERKVVRDLMYYFGVFVLSDAIPWLAWLDLQGHERNMKRIAKELDDLVGEWLQEHKERRRKKASRDDEDFMDAMLTILEGADFPEFEADTIAKATCLNMVIGGSDTIRVTLTWAVSLLLNNPHALNKARQEMDAYISKDSMLMNPTSKTWYISKQL